MNTTLKIEAGKKTPQVDFNSQTGILSLSGRCLPDDNHKFFAPLLEWIDGYVAFLPATTTVIIQLEYLQTGASLKVLELLKKLLPLAASGKELLVRWGYEGEDEDMMQTGQDFSSVINYPFRFETFGK